MNRVALLAVAASLAVAGGSLLAACGGTSNATQQRTNAAGAFVRQVTLEFSRGQSGRLWDQLLGSDQSVVSRSRFVECQANTGWNLKSLKILDGYSDAVTVGAKTIGATAVTVRVTSDDGVTTATMHAVPVGSGWRWVLQPSDRQAYLKGKCPRSG